MGKIVALFAAPAVMALTITLPVVVTPYRAEKSMEKLPTVGARSVDSRLVDFEEEGVEVGRALIAEQETVEELHELKYNKWLMAAQCVFGPLWCVAILFGKSVPASGVLASTNDQGFGVRWNGARDVVFDCHLYRWYRSCHPCSDILYFWRTSNYAHPALFYGILCRHHLDHGHRR